MVVHKEKKQISEDPNVWPNGRAQTKENISEKGPRILVERSCANKRNKTMRTLERVTKKIK